MADFTDSEAASKIPASEDFFGWKPLTNSEWAALADPHLIVLRLAWLNVSRSKAENITTARGLFREDILAPMLNQMADSARFFEFYAEVLRAGYASVLDASRAG